MVAEAAGGFSGERSPWKQAPVSVVLPQQQYRRQGKVGGSDGSVTSGDKGGWAEEGPE